MNKIDEEIFDLLFDSLSSKKYEDLSEAEKMLVDEHLTAAAYTELQQTWRLVSATQTQKTAYNNLALKKGLFKRFETKHSSTQMLQLQVWRAAALVLFACCIGLSAQRLASPKESISIVKLAKFKDTIYLSTQEQQVQNTLKDTIYIAANKTQEKKASTKKPNRKEDAVLATAQSMEIEGMAIVSAKSLQQNENRYKALSFKDDTMAQSFHFVAL